MCTLMDTLARKSTPISKLFTSFHLISEVIISGSVGVFALSDEEGAQASAEKQQQQKFSNLCGSAGLGNPLVMANSSPWYRWP